MATGLAFDRSPIVNGIDRSSLVGKVVGVEHYRRDRPTEANCGLAPERREGISCTVQTQSPSYVRRRLARNRGNDSHLGREKASRVQETASLLAAVSSLAPCKAQDLPCREEQGYRGRPSLPMVLDR